MKYYIAIFFLLCFNSLIIGQSRAQNDSLLSVLKATTKQDKSFVDNYFNLSRFESDVKKLSDYKQKIYTVSKKINYSNGLGHYYSVLSKIKHVENKFEISNQNAKKAASIYYKNKDSFNYLNVLEMQVTNSSILGDLDMMKDISDKALLYAEKSKLYHKKGFFYYALGNYYLNIYNKSKALFYFEKSAFYTRKAGVSYNLTAIYDEIANIYILQENYSKAKEYCDLSFKIIAKYKIKFPIQLASFYNLRANIFIKTNQLDSALYYGLKADEVVRLNKMQFQKNLVCNNSLIIAKVYYQKKQYKKCIYFANRVRKVQIEENDYNAYYFESLGLCGLSHYQLGNFRKALDYQKRAIAAINKSDEKEVFQNMHVAIFKDISATAYALKDYKEAYNYYDQFSQIKIKNLEKKNTDRINELLVQYDVKEKDLAYKNTKLSEQKKKVALDKQKNISTIAFVIIASLIIICSIIYISYRKNIKKKRRLEAQNLIIQSKNQELETSQKLLQLSLEEKEVLLKEIHHRVKNNLQLVMSLLNIQAREGRFTDIKEFLQKGQSRISSMALIHQNLYETENLGKVNFHEYLEKLVQVILDSYEIDDEKIKVRIEAKDCFFDIQTSIPLGLIVNELITNAVKHAFPLAKGGNIDLTLIQMEKDNYQMIVRDNGVGFIHKKEKKSLGLELVHLLVQQLKGTVSVQSEEGTLYQIQFCEVVIN